MCLRGYAFGNDHNVNFNAFDVDMVFFRQFAPGSELNIVWKQAILNSNDEISADYYNNLKGTFNSPQNNMLSLKILYYLDYLQVRSALRLKTRT